ncbi:hypothetical protein RHMOL_Rhmol08G0243400 [Rhododendron molle]|uniref:Uncharacterized protein n=1 Tax=Rhododendron molle TaxID=49168 RepID=A0ACC0MTX2_RHOML|nr:hypothetical protein RHMOL_Rhmol08G0243400 [Rhododendron molle]
MDDIQVFPASLSSVGSPQLLVVLRKGRGLDARQGQSLKMKNGFGSILHHSSHSMLPDSHGFVEDKNSDSLQKSSRKKMESQFNHLTEGKLVQISDGSDNFVE